MTKQNISGYASHHPISASIYAIYCAPFLYCIILLIRAHASIVPAVLVMCCWGHTGWEGLREEEGGGGRHRSADLAQRSPPPIPHPHPSSVKVRPLLDAYRLFMRLARDSGITAGDLEGADRGHCAE